MKNKKKNKKIKKYILITIIFFITITIVFYYFINDNRKNNFIFRFSKDLTGNITKVLSFSSTDKNQNKISDEINKDLEKEIKSLKKTLDLNELLSDKKLVNASIIKRSTQYWYNIITINKGTKDGIKLGNAVVTDSGLIGKIIKVNKNTSDVKLLISKKDNNYISAMFYINDTLYYGLIDEYNNQKNELYLKNVIGDFKIDEVKGINVVTSGLSDSFSSGLLIGKIKNISKEKYGISNTISITPSADFNDLKILTVIVGENK